MNIQAEQQALPISSRQIVFGLLGGLIPWALHFGIVYAPVSLYCERGMFQREILGITSLQFIQIATTVIALLIVGAASFVSFQGWRKLREQNADQTFVMEGSPYPFLMFVSFLLNSLFLLTIAVSLIPILFIEPCSWQIL